MAADDVAQGAQDAMQWIQMELQSHELTPAPDTSSLCAFLRDGRALCLLATALDERNETIGKHLQRSLHQLSTFHSLERIQFFIKWCRNDVRLEEQHIFTSVQLLDEANDSAVFACVDALRTKFRPNSVGASQAPKTPVVEKAMVDDVVAPHDENTPANAIGSIKARPASASRLHSFLSKFPSDTAIVDSSDAIEPEAPVIPEDVPVDAEPSPSSPKSTSRLKIPSIFSAAASAFTKKDTSAPTTAADAVAPKATTPGKVAKLEIPGAFARRRSLSCGGEEMTQSSSSMSPPPAPATSRSRPVSKLQIPSAFSASSPAPSTTAATTATTPVRKPASPSPSPRAASSPSPQTKLGIPAAFTRANSDSPAKSPLKASATASAESSPEKSKTPARLKIPSAFTQTATPTQSVTPAHDKPASPEREDTSDEGPPTMTRSISQPTTQPKRKSKLAAFLSTVEVASAFSSSSTPSAAEPVVQQEPVAPVSAPAAIEVPAEPEAPAPVVAPEASMVLETPPCGLSGGSDNHSENEEQPFFVVEDEQVQKTPKPQSRKSKLFAFLSAVDGPAAVPSTPPEVEAAPAPVSSPKRSPKKQRSPSPKKAKSPRSPRRQASVDVEAVAPVVAPVAAVPVVVAEDTELRAEKDRLAQECSDLKQKVATLEGDAARQQQELQALRDELLALREQMAVEKAELERKHQSELESAVKRAEDESKTRAQAEILVMQERLAKDKKELEDQVRSLTLADQVRQSDLEAVREELKNQQALVHQAKDSEEAARFAAQMAFAARDEAEEMSRLQKKKIEELTQQLQGSL
ncbi:TPA: hypothetical protein N0F65_000738 [Lagenidium giganteum]|uniref:Calponin-homology (CH) domain-containing protein n=1 Tax=Lagenidium giganteum TaxID=4803 RepID=A0AAV2ZHL8_9STRA|nr:TPA: hypothetical protein N0F65_000738 [Lagenidium giganteum]